ncbi:MULTISPECIES: xanthine dehydrogenase family protein molybdopterin-binding subunit [Bradyrhizobium]|jgi:isoquinoline 1-oxidoreductase beta subunit|uniref:Xanthine dehydrogenase family protein molybdopterin-binding subunit n=4 Tax=Bradyrhizobium TaxID=374 RepID=A0ABS5G893_9BRAD|nr:MULTISPECIES: molybdopterin cofactor-binding domain-containing protein [Bradyrhizobium]MBR1137380.1 xanthine dehydrogenase family protein molybdopterin-binding subunit [Bradyrhizobium denitrificans]MDU1491541.1 molybdopterin cofactor-binding domain-containing protein [Bradyrhizobium sp.]MDU1541719.1 molybdopterin cofactor-binding domain-containing protein [Bradyrhizobium sp.]MDU1802956.1 molybdopterin cofactor-binding domain-containing protein [Bradyrhizobium sp.]MDU3045010.1 molybdopterin 
MTIIANPDSATSASRRGFERHLKVENVSRRAILQTLGLAGGFVLAAPLLSRPAFAAYETGAGKMPHGTVVDPKIFVSIAPDGIVSILAHRSEMGTGVRTSLPLIVAEEMEADWTKVRVVQAPGDEVKFGNQDTDGSRSTRHYLLPMRQIGAMARAMLEAAAAKRLGVPASEVKAVNHEVVHSASGKRLGFGELAADAANQPVPAVDSVQLKSPKDFRYLGKGQVSIVDLHDITVGKARYGADVRLPGMKYAVIARPPVTGGKVKSFDSAEALKVPGVEQVLEVKGWPWPSKFQPLGGVAVVARNTGAAIKGRDALKVEWDDGPNAAYDSVAYRAELEAAARQPGLVVRQEGDVEAALKSADKIVTGEYYLPHFAHASMEPPVAVADVKGDKAEIWAPVQSPGGTREDVAKTLQLPPENVTVNVTLLGGGFGRKSKCDFALEAALLSKTLGAPVKVQWTRDDDIQHDFLHTVSVERIEAGLDKSGKVVAWRHRSVAPTILSTFAAGADHAAPFELGMGLVDMPFEIANIQCENPAAKAMTRIGWFRSVSNIPRAFAVQSMVGELAHATGRDQKDMLLELIGTPRVVKLASVKDLWNYGEPYESYPIDTGRLRRVVEFVAEKGNWGRSLPKGHGLGIAAHRSFVSYIATIVEVSVDDKGKLLVHQVDSAIDCGVFVNPERIQSQLEGAAIMGLSLAKYGEVSFKNGRVQQRNFDDHPVVRIDEAPLVTNVHIVPADADTPPSGVGEPGVPPFAPALANAIFAATGKRLRALPIGNQLAT